MTIFSPISQGHIAGLKKKHRSPPHSLKQSFKYPLGFILLSCPQVHPSPSMNILKMSNFKDNVQNVHNWN